MLRTQQDPSGGVVVVAYGLDDGRLRWEVDVANEMYLFAIDGRLYRGSEQGIVALG